MADETTIESILLASPPGQFDAILEDVRSLLSKSSLSSLLEPNFVSAIRSEWEATVGRSILDAAAVGGAGSDDDVDGCIASLTKSMDDYIARKFSSPGVRAAHIVTVETVGGTPTITIATYAERIDLHNHHAGSWRGCYTICPTSGDIDGKISVRAHTFENAGNVQLHSDVSPMATNVGACPPSDGGGDDDDGEKSSWTKEVTGQIELWEEKDVMNSLSSMYESMGNTYLKSLRRVMPITRTKMEWNVMAHRVVQTLGGGHDKEKFKH
eukprot:CAMPEP_0172553240 /NCGR_PEP_ID=MMETSP1067-20121228/49585_1 /TAXON_ID=265564 ORGANISM="Thalassiosira punctigera, Strain Tpunct2005C2" /NCGR_SAMPLE_ID=MMETSP1067 /ASSEMBLY_ACC=CAM_ASM_000444 /LENGTH=267 /DNA_ID=CAMNT_0013341389 /DNA_START=97 /DNA_END=900 /DNA_ORIENTATION=-